MADFNYKLNRQGPKGNPGEKGEQGFSPEITVETNTAAEYKLRIVTESDSFVTDNLRGSAVSDQGGTYMRYNPTDGSMYAGTIDLATNLAAGAVYMALDTDIQNENEFTVPNCAQVKDAINSIEIPDISGLATKAELQAIENEIPDVSNFLTEANVSEVAITGSYNDLLNKPTLFSGDYNDLTNKPIIPSAANNGTLTLTSGGQTLGTFTADSSTDVTINIPQSGSGGGSTYTAGDGIDITNDVISVKVDGTTLDVDSSGNLTVIGGGGTPYTLPPATTSSLGGIIVGSGLSVAQDGTLSANSYTLPVATTSTLGGVIPDGTTITVDNDGTIHGATTYTLPTASTSQLGGVKVDGSTITIDSNGVISASSSGGGGVSIDDTSTTSTTETWSCSKIDTSITNSGTAVLNTVASNYVDLASSQTITGIKAIQFGNIVRFNTGWGTAQSSWIGTSTNEVGTLIIQGDNSSASGGTLKITRNALTFYDGTTTHNLLQSGASINDTTASSSTVYSSSKTDSQISAAVANKVSSTDVTNIVKITQTAYDALVSGGTVDANTFYIIIG